jgi:hypothetical protein
MQQEVSGQVSDMVAQLENACLQACKELEEELSKLKNTKNE